MATEKFGDLRGRKASTQTANRQLSNNMRNDSYRSLVDDDTTSIGSQRSSFSHTSNNQQQTPKKYHQKGDNNGKILKQSYDNKFLTLLSSLFFFKCIQRIKPLS